MGCGWSPTGPPWQRVAGEQQQSCDKSFPSVSLDCLSALSLFSRTASDVLIFSFFHCREKSGPGMRTKCSSCMIPSTGKAAGRGDRGLCDSAVPHIHSTAAPCWALESCHHPGEGSSWCFPRSPALLQLVPKSQEQGVSVPGRPTWSERGPQPCWGGGGRHLGKAL